MGSTSILLEVPWILVIPVEDFIHKESDSLSKRNKLLVSLELALMLSETEEIKYIEGSLIITLFGCCYQILELFPLGERNLQYVIL